MSILEGLGIANQAPNASMVEVCADLLNEYRELAALAEQLTPEQWGTKTDFFGWTPWDEIAHLCFFDETGLLSVTVPSAFGHHTQALLVELKQGREISAVAREKYAVMDGAQLLAYWRTRFELLVGALVRLDAKERLAWYGPTMSARSFSTARMMEVWAHGQDIFDVVRARRGPSRRLKHIAHIGVTTYGWSFVNRNLPVPDPIPYVELRGVDGETWTWGNISCENYVRGDAEEFCQLVTQRRNVADTSLQFAGPSAIQWLAIAQCFAGPPATPPTPGIRTVQYPDAKHEH